MDFTPTAAEVLSLTGKTVTDADIAVARASIETIFGIIEATDRPEITNRDLFYLKRIVAYQTPWLKDQPDAFTRSEVKTLTQDGSSVTFTDSGLVLAPFARRAARKLSWRGTRSTDLVAATRAALSANDEIEDKLPWRPM